MSGIGPVLGPAASMVAMPAAPLAPAAGAAAAPTSAAAPQGQESTFGQTLRQCLDRVDGDQQKVAGAVGDLLAGSAQDVLPAVTAAAQADLSFKLLIGVRNKVIEAYKQTLNMQM
jgi:flagellar hook-basal body complex protein FliE